MNPADERWHGWRVRGMALHVGRLPGRKLVCLYRLDSTTIKPLAYFKSEEDAELCLEFMDAMAWPFELKDQS